MYLNPRQFEGLQAIPQKHVPPQLEGFSFKHLAAGFKKFIKQPLVAIQKQVLPAIAGSFTVGLVPPKYLGIKGHESNVAYRVGRDVTLAVGTVAIGATIAPAIPGLLSSAGGIMGSAGGGFMSLLKGGGSSLLNLFHGGGAGGAGGGGGATASPAAITPVQPNQNLLGLIAGQPSVTIGTLIFTNGTLSNPPVNASSLLTSQGTTSPDANQWIIGSQYSGDLQPSDVTNANNQADQYMSQNVQAPQQAPQQAPEAQVYEQTPEQAPLGPATPLFTQAGMFSGIGGTAGILLGAGLIGITVWSMSQKQTNSKPLRKRNSKRRIRSR